MPIFELPAVILPGELMPLHIFEERYKRMIGHCLDSEEPFGIVFRDDDGGARRIGCTARITEVTETFDDGRMNVVVTGEEPFRVLDRFEASEYPSGEVEPIDVEAETAEEPGEAADIARGAFAELIERVSGETPEDGQFAGDDAYAIAARVELPCGDEAAAARTALRAGADAGAGQRPTGAGRRRGPLAGGRRARTDERQGHRRLGIGLQAC